jgi:hypothetical protein
VPKREPLMLAADALYVDDRELRRRINPRLGWDRFRAAVRLMEQQPSPSGYVFPRVKPLLGGRYWPAVLAWLDDYNGINEHEGSATEDGPETFNATPRKKTGIQAGAPRPTLLDRQAGGAQSDGLPGYVHRAAAQRR